MREFRCAEIIAAVADYYGRPVDQLLAHDRHQPLAEQRQVAMFLCRRLTRLTRPAVARAFHRTHVTILHAEQRMTAPPERLRHDIQCIHARLIADAAVTA
ncbi:helix-turn-helix domain-containing protein [Mycobacterium sp. PSTR-4-N]|uniref:helix-turn-helix domain-containing protein n=1 Tax=Mycobacterium sp. PSTR-4-N TaxID=2917745 RepID=UPI001F14E88C|nr:helix-turn-helix domain-containing protein [Mycobacterium sp. PSTR-4-N]MCG7592423.1 hypothetical protein [Mycobacterium sp. PSTR-4-N]